VSHIGIESQPDRFARRQWMSLAQNRKEWRASEIDKNMDFGAGRLDDLDRGWHAVGG